MEQKEKQKSESYLESLANREMTERKKEIIKEKNYRTWQKSRNTLAFNSTWCTGKSKWVWFLIDSTFDNLLRQGLFYFIII